MSERLCSSKRHFIGNVYNRYTGYCCIRRADVQDGATPGVDSNNKNNAVVVTTVTGVWTRQKATIPPDQIRARRLFINGILKTEERFR